MEKLKEYIEKKIEENTNLMNAELNHIERYALNRAITTMMDIKIQILDIEVKEHDAAIENIIANGRLCEELRANALIDFDHLTPEQRAKQNDLPRLKRIENEITNK